MKRIAMIFGTRPEAIKLSPLVLGLQNHSRLDGHVCVTAQHREMLDQMMRWFDVKADYDLDLIN